MDIIGCDETLSEHGFQVSGVRFQAGSRFFPTDTSVPMSNFHAIPLQLSCHSHVAKLNDEV